MKYTMKFSTMIKKPSALMPIGMSLAALALVIIHIGLYGVARQADEGTAAHLFQLLMGLQAPILLYFAVRWLPRHPRQALEVMALQALAALAALAPVFYFQW